MELMEICIFSIPNRICDPVKIKNQNNEAARW